MTFDLHASEFRDFFTAVNGVAPFPWQERLAQQVFARQWPHALDIPTGAGKTAAIDIAVFHLALEGTRGFERRAAARILFVVDRRLIVDEAYQRAQRIARELVNARNGILRRVADRLRALAEDGMNPLSVARLRGGMPKEPDWVRTPAQPTVVVSTIDQVGSRLFFRGYGVSETMRPIHAGLLGADALLLLDEAHLSQPFVQTVRDTFIFRRQPWTGDGAAAPFGVVTLSATQPCDEGSTEEPFKLSVEDYAEPVLAKRLGATKSAVLIEVRSETDLERRLAEEAWQFANANGKGIVAIVVNRVKRARSIFDALSEKSAMLLSASGSSEAASAPPEIALLIGRVRDLDRNKTLETVLPFVQAGAGRQERANPLIVVATQCIEAGADLDFDALATEIAPLDCLRQRFGRLNRMGREVDVRAAIVAGADQIRKTAEDPIYGTAVRATWNLLNERSRGQGTKKGAPRAIDFGIQQSESWFPETALLQECVAPRKNAPVLLPSALQLWSRTSPAPGVCPDVSLYLHGPEVGPGDVSIVWRADIDDAIDDDQKEEIWKERVAVCPTAAAEVIAVPLSEARRWLRGDSSGDIADTEMAVEKPVGELGAQEHCALRWCGPRDDQTGLVKSSNLRPGDVIVVPALRGGCDRWGWNPKSKDPVEDLAREANLQQRGRDILRLSPGSPGLSAHESELAATLMDSPDNDVRQEFAKHFSEFEGAFSQLRVVRASDGRPLALELRLPKVGRRSMGDLSGEAVTEDDESVRSLRQKPVLLSDHSAGVREYARRFAQQAGLPLEVADDVVLAAYLHDAGKAHPNFKRFLYGGDELAAIAGADLAKSARLPGTPEAWNAVRTLADLPKGARHEVASLRFAEAHARFAMAHDPGLVLWLIGTHHGYGRPFFPAAQRDWPEQSTSFETDLGDGKVISKPAHSMADLTAAWFEICERVTRRYGIWGLARLEAIVRLADHRRSEAEQEGDIA